MGRTKGGGEDIVKQVVKTCSSPVKEERVKASDLIPSGCTLLDLACSDNIQGAFQKGKIVNVIGDSQAGKTILCLSTLAEICLLGGLDDYDLYFDDVEAANSFDIGYLFGSDLVERVMAPNGVYIYREELDKEPLVYSDTIQELHYNILEIADTGTPFIYVVDSFDALDSKDDQDKVIEMKNAHRKGKETTGTYGMSKAKYASWMFRSIKAKLAQTGSVLIVVSQTRDNINPISFSKKTRAGGKALRFYSTHEMWLASTGAIKRRGRIIGSKVKIKVTKNKLTGKERIISLPVYYDYGIDDIQANVDFLIEEKHWSKKGPTVSAPDFDFKGVQRKLIEKIERENLEVKLKTLVSKVWAGIEEDLKIDRKRKYC